MSLSLETKEAKRKSPVNMVFCIEGMGHRLSLGRQGEKKAQEISDKGAAQRRMNWDLKASRKSS